MTEKNKDLIAILLICLAVFLTYLNTLPNTFIFDDRHMILNNNYIKNIKHISLFFKGKITSDPIVKGMYRPILMLSFMFNYLTGGLKPYGYHIINILIHFLNAVFLYLFLKLFLKDLSFALRLGITFVFCLHPINTEAVTYISSRSDLLCSLFILSGLYAYILSQNRDSPLKILRISRWREQSLYLLSLGLYILALLSKEIGLALLGLILAYEFTPHLVQESVGLKQEGTGFIYTKNILKDLRRVFLRLLPFILVTLAYLILIKIIFGSVFGLFGEVKPQVPPVRSYSANILTQAAVSFYYLYLFFFPFNLCIDHNFPIIHSFGNPFGLIPLIVILGLIFTCLFLKKHIKPIIGFSCLWYFISLSPKFYARLNLVAAEHQAYLAYFSLYFLLGFLFTKWKINKIYLRQIFFFILGLFFLLTLIRNFQWRNEYLLWKFTLKANPDSSLAKGSLGLYLINRGFIAVGEEYLEQAAASSRDIVKKPTLFNLAAYYALFKNQPQRGLDILNQNKDYLEKRRDGVSYLKTLGIIYLKMGEVQKARQVWERLIHAYPECSEIKSNLGWLYLNNFSDKLKAKEYFQAAIKDSPDLALAHLGLAEVLKEEDLEKAIEEYKKTIKLTPSDSKAYFQLGLIYAQKLLSTQAEWYFKKAIELNPDFAPVYYNLCIFYLSLPTPDFERAQKYFDKARSLGYKVDPEIEEMLRRKELIPESGNTLLPKTKTSFELNTEVVPKDPPKY
jgi:tetratricopeptide (TPR) repeat protein